MSVRSTKQITREDALSELRDRLGMATDEELDLMLRVLCTYANFVIVKSYEDSESLGWPKYDDDDFDLKRPQ